jgi:hypothetical protein
MAGDKLQLNFSITAEDRRQLDEICAEHNEASPGWMALLLLRYGMRHARAAVLDDARRTAQRLAPDEADLP